MYSFDPNSHSFERNIRWKDKHRGEECILMCNGPSLNKVDFSRINTGKYTLVGLNKIYMGFEQFKIRPRYIVSVNNKVLNQSLDVFSGLDIVKFISSKIDPKRLPQGPYTYYIKTTQLPENPLRFNPDIVEYVHEGWTVTHAALQIIFYMGFERVFIIGMDHNFQQFRPGEENRASVIAADDIDHFHPDYFGNGKEWDFPDLSNSEISYRAALKAFQQAGREIIDCSIGGRCDIFPKRDINRLYTIKAND